MKKFDLKRTEDTQEVLKLLTELVAKHPTMRFGQILVNFGFVQREEVTINYGSGRESVEFVWADEIHTEPGAILKRVKDALQRQASSTEG